ncbi:MAG TPA: serine/threonine-protein kinase [Polyangiaceae bacterium]
MEERNIPALSPGASLGDRYRVLQLLGQGGMGRVYAARDLRSGAEVAVKLLRPELVARPRALSRFRREARALVQVESPHVVRVSEVSTLADGTPFFVMERLHGRSLASELGARGKLPLPEAMSYVVQAARGAHAAHRHGIVHRDLKPDNLFLVDEAGERRVKVLDFGISKFDLASALRVTETNSSLGTPAYMSPEQLRSAKHVDARSDVWSLGVIAYQLVTGRLPFEARDPSALARAVVREPPRPIAELEPGVPAELAAAVMRALRKDPADRPGDAAALAVSLTPFADARALAAVTSTPEQRAPIPSFAGAPAPGDTHADTPLTGSDGFAPARSRAPSLARLVLLGMAAGVVVSLLLHCLRRAGLF